MMRVDTEKVTKTLKSHFFFSNLGEEEMSFVIGKMFYAKVEAGEFIFNQNDKGSCFFVIDKGKCDVIIGGEKKKTLEGGQSFGE